MEPHDSIPQSYRQSCGLALTPYSEIVEFF